MKNTMTVLITFYYYFIIIHTHILCDFYYWILCTEVDPFRELKYLLFYENKFMYIHNHLVLAFKGILT